MDIYIKEGDTVDVHYTDSNLANAEVLYMPAGPGDLLQVSHNGQVYAINTQHPAFLYLQRTGRGHGLINLPKEETNEN